MKRTEANLTRGRLRALIGVIAVALLSAAPPATPEDFVRRGNELVAKGKYEEALKFYQEAEERGRDPGLVAFNKATAYFHLTQYRQAENHYCMALDDDAMPPERRARAFYNLGICLIHQASEGDHKTFREAIRGFENCLDSQPDAGLRRDAEHNLELAKLLWNKARAKTANPPTPNADEPPEPKRQPETKKKETLKKEFDNELKKSLDFKPKDAKTQMDDKGKEKVDGKQDSKTLSKAPNPGPSRRPVVPDGDTLKPQTPEDVQWLLSLTESRLRKERQSNRTDRLLTPEKTNGKDW